MENLASVAGGTKTKMARKNLSQVVVDEILELRSQGWGRARIAKKIGIGEDVVRRVFSDNPVEEEEVEEEVEEAEEEEDVSPNKLVLTLPQNAIDRLSRIAGTVYMTVEMFSTLILSNYASSRPTAISVEPDDPDYDYPGTDDDTEDAEEGEADEADESEDPEDSDDSDEPDDSEDEEEPEDEEAEGPDGSDEEESEPDPEEPEAEEQEPEPEPEKNRSEPQMPRPDRAKAISDALARIKAKEAEKAREIKSKEPDPGDEDEDDSEDMERSSDAPDADEEPDTRAVDYDDDDGDDSAGRAGEMLRSVMGGSSDPIGGSSDDGDDDDDDDDDGEKRRKFDKRRYKNVKAGANIRVKDIDDNVIDVRVERVMKFDDRGNYSQRELYEPVSSAKDEIICTGPSFEGEQTFYYDEVVMD